MVVAGKPSPPPNYHLAWINQPPKRAIRSPGVFGDRGFIFSPRGGWGQGRVSKTISRNGCSRPQCDLLVNVPLAQQEDGQATAGGSHEKGEGKAARPRVSAGKTLLGIKGPL